MTIFPRGSRNQKILNLLLAQMQDVYYRLQDGSAETKARETSEHHSKNGHEDRSHQRRHSNKSIKLYLKSK